MRIFILSLFLGLFGCVHHQYYYTHFTPVLATPQKEIPIVIDKNFGNADLVAIDDAISKWNYSLNGYIRLKVVSTNFDMEPDVMRDIVRLGGKMILKVNSGTYFVPKNKEGTITLAWTSDIGGDRIFVVRDRIRNDQMEGVILHELGHSLGSKDIDNHPSVMETIFNEDHAKCIDEWTVEKVAEYQSVPKQNLNYCYSD